MKTSDDFTLWVRDCERTGLELWPIEGGERHGVYMTKKQYWSGNRLFYTAPMYHVWIRGKCVLTGPNLHKALRRWETENG